MNYFPTLPVYTRFAVVLLISFAAGIVNGCVGAGSGIVFMLLWNLCQPYGSSEAVGSRYSFAMACVMIISLVSLFLYPAEASSELSLITLIFAVVCGVLGGIAGAVIKDKVKASWLNRAFALLTIYSGLSMVFRR